MSKRPSTLRGRISQTTRLGEMLRLYRTVNQMSLRDVAAITKVGHATLMRIEHGETFDVETWFKLMQWLLEKHPAAPPARP